MRRAGSWWCGLAVLVAVLGCASEEGVAQERDDPPPAPTTVTPPRGSAAEVDPKQDTRKYLARVRDQYQKDEEKPFVVTNVSVFVPEVSLFGGGAGEEIKYLVLKRGAATFEVPFARIKQLAVGKVDEDRLRVRVILRDVSEKGAEVLEGTVKASLELRGTFAANGLPTTIKLRETKLIDLEPVSDGR